MTLSMKKGRAAGAQYYTDCMDEQGLNQVDDYYAGSGKEPPGEWYVGRLAGSRTTSLGILDGQAFADDDPERFHNLINGRDAEGGTALIQNAGAPDRVAFHDFTLSAPKSVSVVWSQASEEVRARIEQAQRDACRRALDELSDHAVTRTGKGGVNVRTAALRAGIFPHGSSRENDPQLHSHCVVFNLAETEDGTIRTAEMRPALAHAGTATMLYRCELAWQLRQQGFEIEVTGSNFEIKGVPSDICKHFSKRREQIKQRVEDQLKAMGLDASLASLATSGLFDKATIETRNAKGELTRDELMVMWREQGKELGFGQEEVEQLLAQGREAEVKELNDEELAEAAREALAEVSETQAVFTTANLKTAVAKQLLGRASPEQIDRAYAAVHQEVLETKHKNTTLLTTREQLVAERHLRKLAREETDAHVIDSGNLPSTLIDEQRAAAEGVLADKHMVSVIEGTAGAGKTFTVSAIAEQYAANGYNVTALATSWAAAKNLQGAAKLDDAAAIAAFRSQMRKGDRKLGPKDLLIVDEAGQSGVQDLRAILAEAEKAGAKVVLLGDTKQQKAVAAGDGLRAVADEVGSWRLDEIRRQRDAGDREAVKDFFDGKAEGGLAHHDAKGNVHVEEKREAQLAQLVKDWHAARTELATKGAADGRQPEVLIMAFERAAVRDLNRAAHEARKDAGELGNSTRVATMDCPDGETSELSENDDIVFRVNRHDLGVTNQTRGTIEKIDHEGILHVRLRGADNKLTDQVVQVNLSDEKWEHKDGGVGIAHDYAWTVNSAQGQTVDRAFVFDSKNLKRDSAGVAMSRHRDRVDVYVSHEDRHARAMSERFADEWQPRSSFTREDVIRDVAETWSRTNTKQNATDFAAWTEVSTGIAPDEAADAAIENARERAREQEVRAREIAEAAIDKARTSSRPAPLVSQVPPATPTLAIHQRDHFALKVQPPSHDVAEATLRQLHDDHGISATTLRQAREEGFLRLDQQGRALFVATRDDGAALKLEDEQGRVKSAPQAALRERFTPVLEGSPDRVRIVSTGLAALQVRSLQQVQQDAGQRGQLDTIIVARRPEDLQHEDVQLRIARAAEVIELSPAEEATVAVECISRADATQANATQADTNQELQQAATQLEQAKQLAARAAEADIARRREEEAQQQGKAR